MPAPHGPGMADAVLSGILRSGKTLPYAATELDRELLAACDAAVHTKVPLVLVLPFAAPGTAVTIAAAAVVSAIVNRRDLDVSVAVAARNLASAITYDRLFLRDEQLSRFVSRARITPDGQVNVLRRGQGTAGRLYVAPSVDRLAPVLTDLDAVVIDSSADQPFLLTRLSEYLPQPGVEEGTSTGPVVVYLTRSPFDPNIEALRARDAIVWGWDTASFAALAHPARASTAPTAHRGTAGAVTVATSVLTDAGNATVKIIAPAPRPPAGHSTTPISTDPTGGLEPGPVPEPEFDEALTELWRAIGALAGAYGTSTWSPIDGSGSDAAGGVERKSNGTALRWVWSTFYVVATLPVAAGRYDEHATANPYMPATRLADVGPVAREFARSTTGDRREAWYRVANAFEDAIVQDNGKLAPLVAWVNDTITARRVGAIAVRDRASVAAVTEALSSRVDVPDRWQHTIRVVRVADLPALTTDPTWRSHAVIGTEAQAGSQVGDLPAAVCLTGALPRAAAGLLAAPPVGELTVIVAGPQEASRVYRAATQARRRIGEIRWETVEMSSVLLDVQPGAPYEGTDPAARLELGTYAGDVPDDENSNPWEPFSDDVGQLIFDLLTEAKTADETPTPPVRLQETGPVATVDAVVVRLSARGGRTAWMPLGSNDLVTRRRRDRVERAAGKSLEHGDALLLVDREGRRDLLSAVLEKLSESMAYSTLMLLIGLWHERAALVRGGDTTYGDILRRMDGTAITSDTTIGSWVRADVDGPLDKKDVARFAKAVGDHRLEAEAERVGWALTTLHRVHRKAGAWLTAQLDGAAMESTDATVDAALNIHVSDLLEAVTSWTVEAVEATRLNVDVTLLGLLLTDDEIDMVRNASTSAEPGTDPAPNQYES